MTSIPKIMLKKCRKAVSFYRSGDFHISHNQTVIELNFETDTIKLKEDIGNVKYLLFF